MRLCYAESDRALSRPTLGLMRIFSRVIAEPSEAEVWRNLPPGDYIYETNSTSMIFRQNSENFKSLQARKLGVPEDARTIKKMLKMKDDPTMCMKTQGRMTKCPPEILAFLRKSGRI